MDILINIGALAALVYFVAYAYDRLSAWTASRRIGVAGPTTDRIEHERRMLARRKSQYR